MKSGVFALFMNCGYKGFTPLSLQSSFLFLGGNSLLPACVRLQCVGIMCGKGFKLNPPKPEKTPFEWMFRTRHVYATGPFSGYKAGCTEASGSIYWP